MILSLSTSHLTSYPGENRFFDKHRMVLKSNLINQWTHLTSYQYLLSKFLIISWCWYWWLLNLSSSILKSWMHGHFLTIYSNITIQLPWKLELCTKYRIIFKLSQNIWDFFFTSLFFGLKNHITWFSGWLHVLLKETGQHFKEDPMACKWMHCTIRCWILLL